jgi:hypothetical protein
VGLTHSAVGRRIGAAAIVAALALLPAAIEAAPRAKTRFDAIRDCERAGAAQFLRHNPAFRRFLIDRTHLVADKYADQVGNAFVSTIFHGRATYEAGAGPRKVQFICLHGGVGRDALFVYTLPE